jgi:hypothetical protein
LSDDAAGFLRVFGGGGELRGGDLEAVFQTAMSEAIAVCNGIGKMESGRQGERELRL